MSILNNEKLLQKGVSGASCFIGEYNGKKAFLKYMDIDLKTLKRIATEYTECGIKTPSTFEIGRDKDGTFMIVEFIEGPSLFDKYPDLDIKTVYKIGYEIGRQQKLFSTKYNSMDKEKLFKDFVKEKLDLIA